MDRKILLKLSENLELSTYSSMTPIFRLTTKLTRGIVTPIKTVTMVTMILDMWTSWLLTILAEPRKML